MGTRPLMDSAELTRAVSELARDVERIDSILNLQRQLFKERTPNAKRATRQWKQIRAGIGTITTKTRQILDELGQPNSRRAMAGGRDN